MDTCLLTQWFVRKLWLLDGNDDKVVNLTSHCAGLLAHVAAQRMKALAHDAMHSLQVSFPARLVQSSDSSCTCGVDTWKGTAMTTDRKRLRIRSSQACMMA